jgi:hypothetical protein
MDTPTITRCTSTVYKPGNFSFIADVKKRDILWTAYHNMGIGNFIELREVGETERLAWIIDNADCGNFYEFKLKNLKFIADHGWNSFVDMWRDREDKLNYRRYEHLEPADYPLISEKAIDFERGKLTTLDAVPGIGEKNIEILADQCIHTIDQLMGKFLLLDRDTSKMLDWCREISLFDSQLIVYSLAKKASALLDD